MIITLSVLTVEVVLTEAVLTMLSFESDLLSLPPCFDEGFLKSIYKDFIYFYSTNYYS